MKLKNFCDDIHKLLPKLNSNQKINPKLSNLFDIVIQSYSDLFSKEFEVIEDYKKNKKVTINIGEIDSKKNENLIAHLKEFQMQKSENIYIYESIDKIITALQNIEEKIKEKHENTQFQYYLSTQSDFIHDTNRLLEMINWLYTQVHQLVNLENK